MGKGERGCGGRGKGGVGEGGWGGVRKKEGRRKRGGEGEEKEEEEWRRKRGGKGEEKEEEEWKRGQLRGRGEEGRGYEKDRMGEEEEYEHKNAAILIS